MIYDPYGGFLPDGHRILFTAAEPGRATRVYVQEIPDGRPVPITPEGFRLAGAASISPAGDFFVAVDQDENLFLCSILGGTPRPFPGAVRDEAVARWAGDGRAIIVFETAQIPARVFMLGLDGGRDVVRILEPTDLAGAIAIHRLVMAAGAEAYAYTLDRQLSDLYVAAGFREPSFIERLPLVRRVLTALSSSSVAYSP
jgi:hypothetical protein